MTSHETYTAPARWLKRRLALVGILLLFLCLLWCIWAWIAHRRFQSQLDAIAARHEPLEAAEFELPTLPDSQNAAKAYSAAAWAIAPGLDSPRQSNLTYPEYPPYPPEWNKLADAAVAANANALALSRKARGINKADWGTRLVWPFNMSNALGLNSQRQLANLVGDAALHAHLHGDDVEAVERARDVIAQSEAIYPGGTLINWLVGIGIQAIATQTILTIAPDLEIRTPSSTNAKAVSPEVVRALIRQLLDESSVRSTELRSMEGERIYVMLECKALSSDQYLLKPLWQIDSARVLERRALELRAAACTDAPSAQKILDSGPKLKDTAMLSFLSTPTDPTPPRFSHAISEEAGNLDRIIVVAWRSIAQRRAAAISLAIQLYRADHHAWPATLGELVPEYLPSIPSDPFQFAGTPMGYTILRGSLPNGGDRPMVYIDPTGKALTNPPPAEPNFVWEQGDGRQWWDLSRWAPSPATTKP